MQILLANPRGFCAGVDRAIEIVERALDLFGAPVYVRHEVVHNKYVVNSLRDKGAIFVEELDEVPDEATVIFSAHGVSKAVRDVAARRGLRVFDAICPLVTKVHMEVGKYQDEERECNVEDCAEWNEWEEWGECKEPCFSFIETSPTMVSNFSRIGVMSSSFCGSACS